MNEETKAKLEQRVLKYLRQEEEHIAREVYYCRKSIGELIMGGRCSLVELTDVLSDMESDVRRIFSNRGRIVMNMCLKEGKEGENVE